MSKKIIAVTLLFAVLFTCVFTACDKDEEEETRVYIEPDEYDFVTDEDGSRVYNENGEFLVYATDDHGKRVTNEDGEPQTLARPFEPVEEDDKYEAYSYSFTLPEGWKATNALGDFENAEKGQRVSIRILNETYDDYYDTVYEDFKEMKKETGVSVTWEEDVEINENCTKAYRFTLSTDEGCNVMYVFLNSGNLYKVLFETADTANAVKDSEEICKAIAYKPYAAMADVAAENMAKEQAAKEAETATSAETKAE